MKAWEFTGLALAKEQGDVHKAYVKSGDRTTQG